MMNRSLAPLLPYDEHNQLLERNARPLDHKNPSPSQPYHLVIVGAGTAGLVTAAGAAGLGARVALIERELMGGDCLNVGCVPSKGLLSAARAAVAPRRAQPLGVEMAQADVDFSKVMTRMRSTRARISFADSVERFSKLGVDVYLGAGSFTSDGTIQVLPDGDTDGERTLQYKKAVLATGARAAAPPVPGLESVEYLTNETLFSLTSLPRRLGIIGGGPIGCEMAQAFARLGSEVLLFERGAQLLSREDPDAASVVQASLQQDGVQLFLNSRELSVSPAQDHAIQMADVAQGAPRLVEVDQLLVAAGRAPNVEDLGLEAVGVACGKGGVIVNDFLQTTNSRVYAAGDVCSRFKFTHAADFMARIVIQNSLFAMGPFGRRRVSELVIPWATYTSPEIAHVGMTDEQAKQAKHPVNTYIQPFSEVDRAILDGNDEGLLKVHCRPNGELLGATIVAENAGDLIAEVTLAMTHGIRLGQVASTIHAYPTQADAFRKLADQFNRSRLTPRNRMLLNALRRFNVGK